MQFSDDNSAILTFLLGVIVLVMTGWGLTLVVEGRFAWSKRVNSLERSIQSAEDTITCLEFSHQKRGRKLARTEAARLKASKNLSTLRREQDLQGKRIVSLEKVETRLRTDLSATEKEFSAYRERYRTFARAAGTGERLGTLRVRGGREYHNAVIRKVTDVGLVIRHESGVTRLRAPDLDAALQDRFQWQDEERRLPLAREAAHSQQNH